MVLHVVPHAEGDLEQFVAQLLGVGDGVGLSAEFDPVEVGVGLEKALVRLMVERIVIGEGIRPRRR